MMDFHVGDQVYVCFTRQDSSIEWRFGFFHKTKMHGSKICITYVFGNRCTFESELNLLPLNEDLTFMEQILCYSNETQKYIKNAVNFIPPDRKAYLDIMELDRALAILLEEQLLAL